MGGLSLRVLKLYVVVFLYFSVFLGISVSFLFYFLDPFTETFREAFIWGMGAGILFGIFMSWKFVPEQFGENGEIYELRPEREISLDLDLNKSYEKIKDILEKLGFKIKKIDPNFSFLKASSGVHFSGPSWGENIEIVLKKTNQGKTSILVSSKPKIPTQILDKGVNVSNVENIIDELKQYSKVNS